MNSLVAAAKVICFCALISSAVMIFIPAPRMRKPVNLVLSLVIICSSIHPLSDLISQPWFSVDYSDSIFDIQNSEDDYTDAVLDQTAKNLVQAANDILLSEGIEAENITLSLQISDKGSIYISGINIYISREYESSRDTIERVIIQNFSKEPRIIIEQ